MAASQTAPLVGEIFCSELPSPCNLYLAGKRAASSYHYRRNKKVGKQLSSASVLRFATEGHSLTVTQNSTHRKRGGDGYSLSTARLPTLASSSGKDEEKTKKSTSSDNQEEQCLSHSSVFWEDLPQAYRIDFGVVTSGEKNAPSKPRVQFKFGYFHGAEHELIVAWSFSSGKWIITVDGKENFCHGSDSHLPNSEKLHSSWRDEAGHTYEVNVHAAPMSLDVDPDCKQYDLLIDGISFFDMPEISQIGGDQNERHQHPVSSMEVFAVTRTPISENDTKEQKMSSDNNSLTTHGSHSLSEGGKDGAESVDAAAALSTKNEAGGSILNSNNDKQSASPNYNLMVKSRVLLEQKNQGMIDQRTHNQSNANASVSGGETSKMRPRMISNLEAIPLDFRPMSVHATELHVSLTDPKRDSDNNNTQARCLAIGVFVASVDDNKLRMYVTTKEGLQRRSREQNSSDASCFVPVALSDTSSMLGVEESIGDPFTFSAPIMAMDTCVAQDESSATTGEDQEKNDMQLNHLAIACYDGTVRILTYHLKVLGTSKDGNDYRLQLCCKQCSSFIVDGPVVSLHFGKTCVSEIPQPQTSTLFLVAGSLCGFACVFYESSQPASNDITQDGSMRFFAGPLSVVDGLYDARREGYEDCVTSVHVCYGIQNCPMIAVGTQSGRLLLFEQCQKDRIAHDKQVTADQQEHDVLLSQIGNNEKEISQLQIEKEEVDVKARDLRSAISEIQRKIENLENEVNATNIESVDSLPFIGYVDATNDNALGFDVGEESLDDSFVIVDKEVMESTQENDVASQNEDFENELPLAVAEIDEVNPIPREEVITEHSSKSDDKEVYSEAALLIGKEKEPESTRKSTATGPNTPTSFDEVSNFRTKLKISRADLSVLEQMKADHTSKIAQVECALEDLKKRHIKEKNINLNDKTMHAGNVRKFHRYKLLTEVHLPYPIHGIASAVQTLFVSTRRSFHVLDISRQPAFNTLPIDEAVGRLEEKLSKMLTT